MIVFNRDRLFSGGRCGVIHAASFRCALITGRTSTMVSTFAGEWDFKNYEPVAKALFAEALSRQRMRQVHDEFLKQLDWCGLNDADLSTAVEQVFGQARQKNIVSRYENNAGRLLARTDDYNQPYQRLLRLMHAVEDATGAFPARLEADGTIVVNAELERELNKPGNEGLRELLNLWMRTGPSVGNVQP